MIELNIADKIKKLTGSDIPKTEFSFGDKIQSLRKRYGLSQGDFGKLLGLTKGQISSYEREISQPTLETIIKIAQFFNCAIEELTDIPIRSDFYLNWLLDQEIHRLEYNMDISKKILFNASAGLVEVKFDEYLRYGLNRGISENEPPVVATNFLLLYSQENNELITYFESIFDKLETVIREDILMGVKIPINETLLTDGYPLLFNLYMQLGKGSWLGRAEAWPTIRGNILALQLSNGRIIRLHISNLSTGCQLYGSYCKDLEERIKIWQGLDKKNAKSLAIEYALEWNRIQTEEEVKLQEEIIRRNKQFKHKYK